MALFLSVWFVSGLAPGHAADRVPKLETEAIRSMQEMRGALALLRDHLAGALERGEAGYAAQRVVLEQSGAVVSRLAYLWEERRRSSGRGPPEARELFLANRELLKRILASSEAVVRDLQENELDRMEDPGAFLRSRSWLEPQVLISLAAYWLGWNGYYASLVLSGDDPLRSDLLEEATDGFSRAFVGLQEADTRNRSLVGRGLCYVQLGRYERALRDLETVKAVTRQQDPLHARCLCEEARIRYETGNARSALTLLDHLEEDYAKDEAASAVLAQAGELRARILLARLEKREASSGGGAQEGGGDPASTFFELKRLADRYPGLNGKLYGYVQAHGERLEHLSPAELGPFASLAMGDRYFQRGKYEQAAKHYLRLLADPASVPVTRRDGLCYRMAYIHATEKRWPEAVSLLAGFETRFPESPLRKEASSLYYTAAGNAHRQHPSPGTYDRYIEAVRRYLERCEGCPERSEAHFQLGLHLLETGDARGAREAFLQVREDSASYAAATIHVLRSYVEELEALRHRGEGRGQRAEGIYRAAVRLLERFDARRARTRPPAAPDALETHRILLEARLRLLGPETGWANACERLEGAVGRSPSEGKPAVMASVLKTECAFRLGRPERAEREIARLTRDAPVDPETYAALQELAGRFYREAVEGEGQGEGGASRLEAAAALVLYEHLRRISRASPSFQRHVPSIQLRMGRLHMGAGNLEQAIGLYREVLAENPRSADALFSLGLLYEKTGRWEEALHAWRRVSEGLEPGTRHWLESRYRTAVALHRLGMTERACAVVTMTRVLHPDLGDAELRGRFLRFAAETCGTEGGE